MGWRDINMNRRKPQLRLAVVPMTPGEDRTVAVLRKAVASAAASLAAQTGQRLPAQSWWSEFAAGYLMGFARQVASKHGVDGEAMIGELAAEVSRQAGLSGPVASLDFVERAPPVSTAPPRTKLRATSPAGDAGYLTGHLEALCGSRKLLRLALERMRGAGADAASPFLTDCDVAADPLQTREPTRTLRFTSEERAAIREAFATLADEGAGNTA